MTQQYALFTAHRLARDSGMPAYCWAATNPPAAIEGWLLSNCPPTQGSYYVVAPSGKYEWVRSKADCAEAVGGEIVRLSEMITRLEGVRATLKQTQKDLISSAGA